MGTSPGTCPAPRAAGPSPALEGAGGTQTGPSGDPVMGQEGDTHVDDVGELHQDEGLGWLGWRAHGHHQHLGGDSQGGPAGRGSGCHGAGPRGGGQRAAPLTWAGAGSGPACGTARPR